MESRCGRIILVLTQLDRQEPVQFIQIKEIKRLTWGTPRCLLHKRRGGESPPHHWTKSWASQWEQQAPVAVPEGTCPPHQWWQTAAGGRGLPGTRGTLVTGEVLQVTAPWLLLCLRPSGSQPHAWIRGLCVSAQVWGCCWWVCVTYSAERWASDQGCRLWPEESLTMQNALSSLGGTFYTICADNLIMLVIHSEIKPWVPKRDSVIASSEGLLLKSAVGLSLLPHFYA